MNSSGVSGDLPPYPPTLGEALEEIASMLEIRGEKQLERAQGAPADSTAMANAEGRFMAYREAAELVREYDGDPDE